MKKITIGQMVFECQSKRDDIAFHHEAKAFYKGKLVGNGFVQYWNRTRERRDFQTVVFDAIEKSCVSKKVREEAFELAYRGNYD